jgi:hypothetical protein
MRRFWVLLAVCSLLSAPIRHNAVLAQNAKPTPQQADIQDVISEGVGTADVDAIQNALRDAVRQVVGSLVDAETLLKNDKVIEDKILAFSDRFIKRHEEVTGSKKVTSGLHRIKIKVQVERRTVIAKLRTLNVTMTESNGGGLGSGLYNDIATQLVAKKDAAELLKKLFEGFPQAYITAKVMGQPKILDKSDVKVTLEFKILVEPDWDAFKAFSDRLSPVVDRFAKSKGKFTTTFANKPGYDGLFAIFNMQPNGYRTLLNQWFPIAFRNQELKEDSLVIAVANARSGSVDKISYNTYEVDKALQPIFVEFASRRGVGKIELLGQEGITIARQQFELCSENGKSRFNFPGTLVTTYGVSASMPYERHAIRLGEVGLTRLFNGKPYPHKILPQLFLVSPTFFERDTFLLRQTPKFYYTCKVSVSLIDLKALKQVKAEIISE